MQNLPTFRPYANGDAKILDQYAEDIVFLVGDGDLTPDGEHCFYLLQIEDELIGYCEVQLRKTEHLNRTDCSLILTKFALRNKYNNDDYALLMYLELIHAGREAKANYLYLYHEKLPVEDKLHVYEAATMGLYNEVDSEDYLKSLRVIPLSTRLCLNPGFVY
ncbi:MAG: hypothetical protein J6328_06955 [Bacilli bacterium]|nr:hypothetical protein [Bacilli bacterium]